jgi:hypothetical protein
VIDITFNDGDFIVGQQLLAPAVYLDQWALLDFADDERLGRRMTVALEKASGTLALSWINLVEFSKISDAKQTRRAELLIQANLPRLFFIEIEPFRVIEAEDAMLSGGPPIQAHGDPSLLKAVAMLRPDSPTAVYPFIVDNLFRSMQEVEVRMGLDELADVFIGQVTKMRDKAPDDPLFAKQVRGLANGPAIQHGTLYVLRELARQFLMMSDMGLTRNHAIDWFHAVVPVSYCDIVLLDRHWKCQVEQMRARLKRTGMSFPIAKVFSRPDDGIELFLSELEAVQG